jgi:homoserine acetyltransferase
MAKLTESYLRGMIKQAINEMDDKSYLYDLEDEAYSMGEKEVESAVEHSDELLEALGEIDAAILDLQNDDDGLTKDTEQKIYLNKHLCQEALEQTFFHEIIHILDWNYLNGKLSEDQVEVFSNGLYAFLKNNKIIK